MSLRVKNGLLTLCVVTNRIKPLVVSQWCLVLRYFLLYRSQEGFHRYISVSYTANAYDIMEKLVRETPSDMTITGKSNYQTIMAIRWLCCVYIILVMTKLIWVTLFNTLYNLFNTLAQRKWSKVHDVILHQYLCCDKIWLWFVLEEGGLPTTYGNNRHEWPTWCPMSSTESWHRSYSATT